MEDYKTKEGIAKMSYVDDAGILRWNTNDRVPFGDVIAIYFGGDIAAIVRNNAARDAQTAAFLNEYRNSYTGPSNEERAEARAAHGPGVVLVNIITGNSWRT